MTIAATALCLAVMTLIHASVVAAQASTAATMPPLRPLGRIVATAPDSFVLIQGLLQLSDGRVIVHDAGQRRVVVFDSALRRSTPIIDNTGATPRRYTGSLAGPFRFHGDSTLMFDAQAVAMLLMDRGGAIVRVFAPPAPYLPFFTAGDGHGRLVLQAPDGSTPRADTAGSGGRPMFDSVALMRADALTHRIDTIAYIAIGADYLGTQGVDSCGAAFRRPMLDPLPSRDAWALLPDGTIAIVRARDLHIDWIGLDGVKSASPKLPHEWHRLSDSNKVALVDSLRNGIGPAAPQMAQGRADPTMSPACQAAHQLAQKPDYPTPENMADYAAPFVGSFPVTADADDHVWIRTSDNPSGGTGRVYIVVSRKGDVVDRIQLPGGTTIVGFGPGVVYLLARNGAAPQLVRARIR